MIKTFQYTLQNLDIFPSEISEILGFDPDNIPDPFTEVIDIALQDSVDLFPITAGFKYYDQVSILSDKQQILIESQVFMPGNKIFNQLKNAFSIAIFICSAGNNITNRIKRLTAVDNHMLSYVFDVIGSLIVEKTKDKLIHELESLVTISGLVVSNPFSPGYCNWDISEQTALFSLLPENFCGVRLTESLLMKPIKSASGFIGIGKTLNIIDNECNICGDMNCMYGRIKRQKKN